MTSTEIYAQTRTAGRSPRSLKATLISAFARFAGFLERCRQAQEGEALLDSFSDHVLADIGLRRDRMGPEVANHDLLPRFGSRSSPHRTLP
jgi:uncharacterized protein YjiS (DUF1127 family)